MLDTKIIGHRGYSGKYPENTLLAFKEANNQGVYGVELDVHMSLDGELIVCHDERIDRTSNGKGYIKDLTLDEIKSYLFLNNMDKEKFEGISEDDIKAPTLREFFEFLVNTNMMVNIEIKNNIFRYEGIVLKVLDLINEFKLQDRVIISSFNHHTIAEVKRRDKNIKCGFLTSDSMLEAGNYCKMYNVECYHPLFVTLDEEDFKNLLENKIEINTWTVNEKEHMEVLIGKVDSIITNNIEIAKSLLSSSK